MRMIVEATGFEYAVTPEGLVMTARATKVVDYATNPDDPVWYSLTNMVPKEGSD